MNILLERIKKLETEIKIPLPYILDILKRYGSFIRIKEDDGMGTMIRLSYYGIKFIKKGGYCWGYYIKKILTFKFLFRKTVQYITI